MNGKANVYKDAISTIRRVTCDLKTIDEVKKNCPELGPYMLNQVNFYLKSGKYTDVNSPFSK